MPKHEVPNSVSTAIPRSKFSIKEAGSASDSRPSQANVSRYASFGHMTPMQDVWLVHVLCLWLSLQL